MRVVDTISQARKRIEAEFDEPLRSVVAGYAEMGWSKPLLSEVLEVTEPSLRMFCHRERIAFRSSPLEHRPIQGRPPRMVRHGGREQSLTAWALEAGITVEGVRQRIRRHGSPIQ